MKKTKISNSEEIEEYIKEINRVLITNGCGFIHHSWYHGGEDQSFRNIDGRSNMTPELFKKFVESNGMTIVFQKEIKFLKEISPITNCFSEYTFHKS